MRDNPRWAVVDGSQSAHCCFRATVVDTAQPILIHGKRRSGQFESVAECFSVADATLIAGALNAAIAMEARQGGDACGSVHDSAAIAQNTDDGLDVS